MATFKGYQIKEIDIDRLLETSEILADNPEYAISLLLEPIEEVSDDSVEILPKPSQIWSIWSESFHSICRMLLEPKPIKKVSDDSVGFSLKPLQIESESFGSICRTKLQALERYWRDHQYSPPINIILNSNKGQRLLDGDEFYIYVQVFNIDSIAEHSQFLVDLVDAVNKQALSKIEEKVQEKQEQEKAKQDQEKAKEEFRKKVESINAKCFPGTPSAE